MFDDENVAGLEREVLPAQGLQQFVDERITGLDFVGERDRNELESGAGSGFRLFLARCSWFCSDCSEPCSPALRSDRRKAIVQRPAAKQALGTGFAGE